jgi:hypothetical protein
MSARAVYGRLKARARLSQGCLKNSLTGVVKRG